MNKAIGICIALVGGLLLTYCVIMWGISAGDLIREYAK